MNIRREVQLNAQKIGEVKDCIIYSGHLLSPEGQMVEIKIIIQIGWANFRKLI
jgi:hypothetical protein